MNDLRQAFRQLRKHPFTNAVIILTIALLIGAVSVIYASLRDKQARYTPFPEPDRMVKFWRTGPKRIVESFSKDLCHGYARGLTSFQDLGALDGRPATTLTDVGESASYHSAAISLELLRLAGVTPISGRVFDETDALEDENRIVLISEQMWRDKLGADEQIIGRELRLDEQLHTVVGVLPKSMRTTRLAFNIDVWRPLFTDRARGGNYSLFGRLKPGVSMARAQTELDAVAPTLEEKHTVIKNERAVYPGGFSGARIANLNTKLAESARGTPFGVILVYIFMGIIVASVVGIACFNVANLLLARFSARSREIAIRIAIGAGRGRIMRQLLGETVMLSVLGGLLGLLVSFWFFEFLKLQHVDVRMDWRLYLIAATGAIVLGILVGLLPAIRSAKTNLTEVLKDGGQSVGGRRRHRLRNFLVTSEIAMALILCVVAGLLARSYHWVQNQELGFDPDKILSVRVELRKDVYRNQEDRSAYMDRGIRALQEVPGVESASVLIGGGMFNWSMRDLVTLAATAGRKEQLISSDIVYGGRDTSYFNTMRLLRGRDLSEQSNKAMDEILINEAFSKEHFAGSDPLGNRLRLHRRERWLTIVGVVKNRHPLTNFRYPRAEVVVSHRNLNSIVPIHFMTRTKADAKAMAEPVREALQSLNAGQPLNQIAFINDLLEKRSRDSRGGMVLLGALASVGLFIALLGVYGVVAFAVMERTREVGIRMAIGATRGAALRLMLWQGARLILFGAIPGMLIASAMLSAIPRKAIIFGISPFDPVTYVVTLTIVAFAGTLACFLPARKAARLNPMEALRYE